MVEQVLYRPVHTPVLPPAPPRPSSCLITAPPSENRVPRIFQLLARTFFSIGIWARRSPITAPMAFNAISSLCSLTLFIAARSAFSSIARCIPLVLTMMPIYSMKKREGSSTSISERNLHAVGTDAIQFFSSGTFRSHFSCFPHQFSILRIVVRPARKITARQTSTSALACFTFLPHLVWNLPHVLNGGLYPKCLLSILQTRFHISSCILYALLKCRKR